MSFSDFNIREWVLFSSAIFDLIAAGSLIYLALSLRREI